MTPVSLLARYRALLKPLAIEGLPDLVLFRPLAFLLVLALKRTSVTPDRVSFSAVSMGLLGGLSFAQGTRAGFAAGGAFYLLAAVLDCADGMLARLKGTGTPLGRIIDGTVDYINGVAVWAGLAIGVSRAGFTFPLPLWAIMLLVAVSMPVHCFLVDHFRARYYDQALGLRGCPREEIRANEAALALLRARRAFHPLRLILALSIRYHRTQARIAPEPRRIDPAVYARLNGPMLRAWQAVELSVHILVLAVSGFLFEPGIFFLYTVVLANAWVVILAPVQVLVDRRVAALGARPAPEGDGQGAADVLS
jgi:phosphatidylglycerophosphate synthase